MKKLAMTNWQVVFGIFKAILSNPLTSNNLTQFVLTHATLFFLLILLYQFL